VGSCEHGKESINDGEFNEQLRNYQFLKRLFLDLVIWRYKVSHSRHVSLLLLLLLLLPFLIFHGLGASSLYRPK
jgi:hypothetical protein